MIDHNLLCFSCMARLDTPGQVCPHCGHDNTIRTNGPGYLSACVLEHQYFIGKILGHGGFGVTYIGFDLHLEREVAIKEYYPRELVTRDTTGVTLQSYSGSAEQFRHGRERALEEGRIVAHLDSSPNIVDIYNAFPANGTVYTIMKYIPGVTLTHLVEENGALYWKDGYALLRPIMQALSYIHTQNVIHRDVSPDNVMFDQTAKRGVLLDFGAAHIYMGIKGHSYTLRPCYAPLEQYSGITEQDGRTDEYAMCATLYFLITGQRPPESTQLAYGGIELPSVRTFAPDIPEAFEKVLFKGMALQIADRYPTMNALVDAFDAAIASAEHHTDNPPHSDPSKGSLAVIIGGSAISLIAVVLLILFMSGTFEDTKHPTNVSQSVITNAPTNVPTAVPTQVPTSVPTSVSTTAPTSVPTTAPTKAPTSVPTTAPTATPVPADYRLMDGIRIDAIGIRPESVASVSFIDTRSHKAYEILCAGEAAEGSYNTPNAYGNSVEIWALNGKNGLYDVYIGADGGVILPEDCSYLLHGYENLSEVRFEQGCDTSRIVNMRGMFENCAKLTTLDLSGLKTSAVTDMAYMFYGCSSLTQVNLSGFDTRSARSMEAMFCGCTALTKLDLSAFNTSAVTDMSAMFERCSSLTSLDLSMFNTENTSDMGNMFGGCTALTKLSISSFKTSAVRNMSYMFYGCSGLKELDVSRFNTSNVENMCAMFHGCSSLTSLDVSSFNTSAAKDMSFMFGECSALKVLNLKRFNTSRVENMSGMFLSCSALLELDLSAFDTAAVKDMSFMFDMCTSLTGLKMSKFNTANASNLSHMFHNCTALTALDISSFNTANAMDMSFMFCGCTSLKSLIAGKNFVIAKQSENIFSACAVNAPTIK